MNGSIELCHSYAEADLSASHIDIAVFPPSLHVAAASSMLTPKGISVGAQNIHQDSCGAFTGEVSAEMAREAGASCVIVGHSERRFLFGEDDGCVAAKFAAAVRAGLTPVLCIGETLAHRDAGEAEEVVGSQIECVWCQVGELAFACGLIAYEPIWAIGTGRAASASQAGDMHGFIRNWIGRKTSLNPEEVRIIYGGSVKRRNARELIMENHIDGFLVGGASLDVEAFAEICQAAQI